MANKKEMNDMNPKRAINPKLPHLLHCLTHFQRPALAKANGKRTALKGQRPYPEKEKAAPVYSFCNIRPRPNRPYAVPLSSAAFR